jgi:hypothetical protein
VFAGKVPDRHAHFFVITFSRAGHKLTLVDPPPAISDTLAVSIRTAFKGQITSDYGLEPGVHVIEFKRNVFGSACAANECVYAMDADERVQRLRQIRPSSLATCSSTSRASATNSSQQSRSRARACLASAAGRSSGCSRVHPRSGWTLTNPPKMLPHLLALACSALSPSRRYLAFPPLPPSYCGAWAVCKVALVLLVSLVDRPS